MKEFLKVLGFAGIMIGTIFGAAGRWDLPFIWATLAIYIGSIVTAMFKMDPDLKRERLRPGPGGKDRGMRFTLLPIILAQWIIAGLDVGRFHWSDTVPTVVKFSGLTGLALSMAWLAWSMQVNRFFSPVVRIQKERGHHLIDVGPYRHIRHPGYLGSIGACVCATLALGSWWAMAPAAIFLGVLIRRLVIEDRFLHTELPGYSDYAARVRHRLFPGIW